MDFKQEDSELVPFSNAASYLYTQITGAFLSPLASAVVDALLHDVAHAIVNIATIYGARTDTEPVKPLPTLELRHGAFQRGATVLRTSKGIEYRRLYIRRGDVRSAVTYLKYAGARFARAEELSGAMETLTCQNGGQRQTWLVEPSGLRISSEPSGFTASS